MTETGTGSQKRRKPGVDESPDKSYYILSKSLDVCGKCNKNAHRKERLWVHAVCEGITRDQYKAIKSLFSLDNLYHCKINDCVNRFKNITSEWIKCQACDTSQLESTVTKLTHQYLATEHDVLQKAVSDLSKKIDNLHVQESKLSDQIKDTSDALRKHDVVSIQQVLDRKSNVVVYGIEESPPKTPKMYDYRKT